MMDPFLPADMEPVDRFPIARPIGTPHSASGDVSVAPVEGTGDVPGTRTRTRDA